MLKIVHLSTFDVGGAARAGYRLHRGLASENQSRFVSLFKHSEQADVEQFNALSSIKARLRRKIRSLAYSVETRAGINIANKQTEGFSDCQALFSGEEFLPLGTSADVVNLHWVAGFVDLPSFFVELNGPVVWTLHDMNAFTGGCHYDSGCNRFFRECGRCPYLLSSGERDLSRKIFERKIRALESVSASRFRVVAPSKWLSDLARRSPILSKFDVSHIPYGIDLDVFAPRDADWFKRAIGIPDGFRTIGFVSEAVTNKRKGFLLLLEALPFLRSGKIAIVTVGKGRKPNVNLLGAIHVHLGEVNDDGLLSLIYSAFDLFVIPSMQDNFPNTVLEAMACGTPVVGVAGSGISEMITDGVTGAKAGSRNAKELAEAIDSVLAEVGRGAIGANCRTFAECNYSLRAQAERYEKLYSSLTEGISRTVG